MYIKYSLLVVVVGWGTLFVPLIKGGLCLSLSDLHLVGSPGCGDLKDVSQGVLLTCHSPGTWPGGPVPPLGVTTIWTVSGMFSYGLNRRTVTGLLSRKWFLFGRESLGRFGKGPKHGFPTPLARPLEFFVCYAVRDRVIVRWFMRCDLYDSVTSNSESVASFLYSLFVLIKECGRIIIG